MILKERPEKWLDGNGDLKFEHKMSIFTLLIVLSSGVACIRVSCGDYFTAQRNAATPETVQCCNKKSQFVIPIRVCVSALSTVKKDLHILFCEAQANIFQDATFMELWKSKHSAIYHHFPVTKRL